MFGEICDGLALGAGHRTTVTTLHPNAHPDPNPNSDSNPDPKPAPNPNPNQVTKLPTHMDLNATFMRSTGAWARPDYPNEGYYGGAQKVEDYYGIGSQSQRERREERERIDRLARFEQPGGVHTLLTLPLALPLTYP